MAIRCESAESGVGNGSWVKNSPGFGFETELSGEPGIERVIVGLLRGIEGAGRERRPRNGGESVVTSERKVVPSFQLRLDASPLTMLCCNDPACAEKRRRRAAGAESGVSFRRTNTEHAGGSLNRAVNPGVDGRGSGDGRSDGHRRPELTCW